MRFIVLCIFLINLSILGCALEWSVVSVEGTGSKCLELEDVSGYESTDYAEFIFQGETVGVASCACGGIAEIIFETSPFAAGIDDPISFESWLPVISGSSLYAGVDGGNWREIDGPVWEKTSGECLKNDRKINVAGFSKPIYTKYTYPSDRWGDGRDHSLSFKLLKSDKDCNNQVRIKNIKYSGKVENQNSEEDDEDETVDVDDPINGTDALDEAIKIYERIVLDSPDEKTEEVGEVIDVFGRVFIERNLEINPLIKRDKVFENDIITLSDESYVKIRKADSSIIDFTGKGKYKLGSDDARELLSNSRNLSRPIWNILLRIMQGNLFEIKTP